MGQSTEQPHQPKRNPGLSIEEVQRNMARAEAAIEAKWKNTAGLNLKEVARRKPCRNCRELFTPSREWSEYCSDRCGSQWRNRKKANYSLKLPGPKVALIARLIVRADIERRGFETFEGAGGLIAADPQEWSLQGGPRRLSVVIRVGRYVAGRLQFNPAVPEPDLLAVVVFNASGHSIFYTPEVRPYVKRAAGEPRGNPRAAN